jgi:alpha-glucosidase
MSLPDEPRAFLENVPSVWDETLYLAGEPGTFVVLARRNGANWYIAGINGQDEGQEVMLDVSFLDEQVYRMLLIGDADDGRSFETTEGEITSEDSIHVLMMEQGGFAVRLTPISS